MYYSRFKKYGKYLNPLNWLCCTICCSSDLCCGKPKPNDKPSQIRLIYYTFFYNEATDSVAVLDTLMHPLVACVEAFVRLFGKMFVILVWTLMLNMLFVYYVYILPEVVNVSMTSFLIHFTLGNWLAVNTFFHYFMGWTVNPGNPPSTPFENVVTICKKCIAPKPPRTHHCSVCNKCILKMDHHCPWFNNCIGFYNHRYFFLYCTFMFTDCAYLVTFGFYYYQMYVYPAEEYSMFGLFTNSAAPKSRELKVPANEFYHKFTTIEFFIAFGAMFAVFALAAVNFFIISNGATNIEIKSIKIPFFSRFQNQKMSNNPYDFGFVNNWKIFLGFTNLKSFFTKVIMPSNHLPLGDGVNWKIYSDYNESLNIKSFKNDIYSV